MEELLSMKEKEVQALNDKIKSLNEDQNFEKTNLEEKLTTMEETYQTQIKKLNVELEKFKTKENKSSIL